MLSKQEVIDTIVSGKRSKCIDGRDVLRLTQFLTAEELGRVGFVVRGTDPWISVEWTGANVLDQLKDDIRFGFEKARAERGISAGLMVQVVQMWMWILEDPLQHESERLYAPYGLPFFRAVAKKYNLPDASEELQ
jgi:hypothetical protein